MSQRPFNEPGGPRPPRDLGVPGGAQYEYRVVSLPSRSTRAEATRLLTEQAEYGRWELARTVVYFGGARKMWLRRRIQRVQRADFPLG